MLAGALRVATGMSLAATVLASHKLRPQSRLSAWRGFLVSIIFFTLLAPTWGQGLTAAELAMLTAEERGTYEQLQIERDACHTCIFYTAMEPFCPPNDEFFLPESYGGPAAEGPLSCTTTTTMTGTRTTTITTTVTVFTTTSKQKSECRQLCMPNSLPWIVKCGWPVCAACSECANIDMPTDTPYQAPAMTTPPGSWMMNVSNTTAPPVVIVITTTMETGGFDPDNFDIQMGGSGNANGEVVDNTRRRTTTSTDNALKSQTCLKMCYQAISDGQDWSLLCQWATCVECPECAGTTTTHTTTIIVTRTITTTETTTTSLYPPPTFTSTTSTRSSTTSTISTTSSMTSTTTDRPCVFPSPLLVPLFAKPDCIANLSSGASCLADTIDHPCVVNTNLVLACPENNILPREPQLMSGSFSQKCKICGFADQQWNDTDHRPGWISTTLRFGPNAFLGVVDEEMIDGYGIWVVDNCSRPLFNESVAYVPKKIPFEFNSRCCAPDAYIVDVTFMLPPGTKSAILMVKLHTSMGLDPASNMTYRILPVGAVTEVIFDLNWTTRGTARAGRNAEVASHHTLIYLVLGGLLALRAVTYPLRL